LGNRKPGWVPNTGKVVWKSRIREPINWGGTGSPAEGGKKFVRTWQKRGELRVDRGGPRLRFWMRGEQLQSHREPKKSGGVDKGRTALEHEQMKELGGKRPGVRKVRYKGGCRVP